MSRTPAGVAHPLRRSRGAFAALAVLALALAPACVSSAQHDAALARIDKDRARIAAYQASLQESARREKGLQDVLAANSKITRELFGELDAAGEDTSELLADKAALAMRLEASKLRVAMLQRAQRAAEARAALFHDVAQKLQRMVDTGQLSVRVRDGRMVIALPNDVLFDTAQVDIKPAGRAALREVGAVLATVEKRHFQIAGHTDDVPISTARFPSNWELSAGRALEVTRFLVDQGMRPETLSSAAYGEFDPVASNTTPHGRAKNRRIEITLVPHIDELVSVPDSP